MTPERSAKLQRQARHSSLASIAISRNLGLMGQPLGRLRWEEPGRPSERLSLGQAKPGTDNAFLQRHMDEHREELEEELRQVKAQTSVKGVPQRFPSWPMSKAAWVEWLQENDQIAMELLRAVRQGLRKV